MDEYVTDVIILDILIQDGSGHHAGFDARELSTSVLSRCSVIAKEFRNLNLIRLLLNAANFCVGCGRSNVIAYLQESRFLTQKSNGLTPAIDGNVRQEYLHSG